MGIYKTATQYRGFVADTPFDAVAIGGGVGGCAFVNGLVTEFAQHNVRASIAVVDNNATNSPPWHQSGIPFMGQQSPFEIGTEFVDWLVDNRQRVIDWVEVTGDGLGCEWLEDNRDFILYADRFELEADDTRRLPRSVFGLFLDDLWVKTVKNAAVNGISLNIVSGTVSHAAMLPRDQFLLGLTGTVCPVRIGPGRSGFPQKILCANTALSTGAWLVARNLFVATGMPSPEKDEGVKDDLCYITDIHKGDNAARLIRLIENKYKITGKKVTVAVLGNGPGAFDNFLLLRMQGKRDPTFEKKYNVVVISSNIACRPPAVRSPEKMPFATAFKDSYNTAALLIADMNENLARARHEGYTEHEGRIAVHNALEVLVETLPLEEQAAFRGLDYAQLFLEKFATDSMYSYRSKSVVSRMIQAKVTHVEHAVSGKGMNVFYDEGGNVRQEKADIVINCLGNVIGIQEKVVEGGFLKEILGRKGVEVAGLNKFNVPAGRYQPHFENVSLDVQAARILKDARVSAGTVAARVINSRRHVQPQPNLQVFGRGARSVGGRISVFPMRGIAGKAMLMAAGCAVAGFGKYVFQSRADSTGSKHVR